MRLRVGSYLFDNNAVVLAADLRTNYNRGAQPYSQTRGLNIRGYLSGDGQAALTLAESQLRTALAAPFPDIVFLQDSGAPSADGLLNVGSITGVRIVQGPSFTETAGPEYATIRTFTFRAEAEYPLPGTANYLLEFTESIEFWGGGIMTVIRPALNGPAKQQLVCPAYPYFGVQRGRMVGYRDYFTPPTPAFAFPILVPARTRVNIVTPERKGRTQYQGFETTYQYHFESPTAITAFPNLWTNIAA